MGNKGGSKNLGWATLDTFLPTLSFWKPTLIHLGFWEHNEDKLGSKSPAILLRTNFPPSYLQENSQPNCLFEAHMEILPSLVAESSHFTDQQEK